MEVVVIADTHLHGSIWRLPEPLVGALRRSDAIVHAGDVTSAAAVAELRRLGPLYAVLGNNDHELRGLLPGELSVELGGVRLAVLHDSGATRGRPVRLARRFPDAQVVIFGHSHVPANEDGVGGQVLFNPGSPTQRRLQPHPTYGRLVLEDGRIVHRAIERLEAQSRQ